MNCQKIFLFISLCTLTACKEKSVEVDQAKIPTFSYETSHCVSSAMPKGTIVFSDSVFSYSFSDNLIMDFSSIGNCCPDSNRFIVSHEIRQDTIMITAVDTAQNLCNCNCLYMIHTEVIGLPMDRYVVRCYLDREQAVIDPIHLVTVIRN
jgi:hypothetical protein